MPALNVPHISQWGAGANNFRADCGPASVAMLLAFYGQLNDASVDALAAQTSLAQGDVGLTPYQLNALSTRHGLNTYVQTGTTLDMIRREIDAGRPVIALVAYRYIKDRLDQNDRVPGSDGHFFVIVGVDGDNLIVNDPDYWSPYTTKGDHIAIPASQVDQAIQNVGYARQCIFVHPDQPAAPEAPQENTPMFTSPPKGSKMLLQDAVKLRAGASATALQLAVYPKGTVVVTTSELSVVADGYNWLAVSAPGLKLGFMAAQSIDGKTTLLSVQPDKPGIGTTMYVQTYVLNVRSAPSTTAKIVSVLQPGQAITVIDAGNVEGRDWMKIVAGGLTGNYAAKQYLTLNPPKPPAPPPTPLSNVGRKGGLHVHMNASSHAIEALMTLVRAGKIKGTTIINNWMLANALVSAGVPYVVHRTVYGAGDGAPWVGGVESDIEIGKKHWADGSNQQDHARLDGRVYIQMVGCNEQNVGQDGYFYLGAMQAATAQGRRLAIFADSVGNPDMKFLPDGSLSCPAWSMRAKTCMKFGKDNGHLACLHEYGKMNGMKESTDPGSAIFPDGHRDDDAWLWFGGGRHTAVYNNLVPAEARMQIFIGECGASAANLHGQAFLSDFLGYQTRYGTDPYVVAYSYWTLGGRGLGFDYSCLDEDIDLLVSAT